MATKLKIALTVGGIFFMGAVTGGFTGFRIASHYAKAPQMQLRGSPSELLGGRAADKLNLTDEQKQQIRPIIGRTAEELRNMSRETFSRSAELIAKMDTGLAKILTPEQLDKLREIRTKENERRRQWMSERAKRNESRPESAPTGNRPRPPEPPNQ